MPQHILGLDVGGTKINIGLVTKEGKIIRSQKFPTQAEKGRKKILKNLVSSLETFFNRQVKAIGIGLPGVVDVKKGISVIGGPNLPKSWQKIPLKKILEKKFKVPVTLDNDANCFTLAESISGAAKGYQYVVGLTLGTGIGGGIVMNKEVYYGGQNIIEIGHMVIDKNGPICNCGQRGDLEATASGTAMIRYYRRLTGQKKDTFYIKEKALQGEKMAKKVINLMAEHLGLGLANIIHILNPEIIVIGGGLSQVKILWMPALKEMKKHLIYPSLSKIKVVKSSLGNRAGILGAALLTGKININN